MSQWPSISTKKFEKFLKQKKCILKRTTGDHKVYHKNGLNRPIIVPIEKDLPKFIIKNNLKLLNISTEEFLKKI